MVIFFYGMRITQSVGEEKPSRVVEVMLATVRPTQLLMGKVLGFAGLALTQMLALVRRSRSAGSRSGRTRSAVPRARSR